MNEHINHIVFFFGGGIMLYTVHNTTGSYSFYITASPVLMN